MYSGGRPWVADPNHPNFQAATNATKTVYGVEPYFTREGGSIPITLIFEVIQTQPCLIFQFALQHIVPSSLKYNGDLIFLNHIIFVYRKRQGRMCCSCQWDLLMMELIPRTKKLTFAITLREPSYLELICGKSANSLRQFNLTSF